MRLVVCDTEDQVSEEAYRWLERSVAQTHARSVFLPAGQTARPLYRLLEERKPEWFKALSLVPVDDIMSGESKHRFAAFFKTELPSFQSQLVSIENRQNGVELAILGLGMNGHVAFHEPHLPRDFAYGEVTLDARTCAELKIEPQSKGLSYGVASFMKCRSILMPVIGDKKREIFSRLHKEDPSLPASWLSDVLTVMVPRSLVV